MSALEQLRSQLAAAEERERELSAQLARKAAVKIEPAESSTKGGQSPHRPAASIGLMVRDARSLVERCSDPSASRFSSALFPPSSPCPPPLLSLSRRHPSSRRHPLPRPCLTLARSSRTIMTGHVPLAGPRSWISRPTRPFPLIPS
jgi:hypothetical protein